MDRFEGLATLSVDAREVLRRSARLMDLPAGQRVFGPGMMPSSYVLVLEGSVRVQLISQGGREIVLYRVAGGESCALTTACLLGAEDYLAEAVTETPVRAVSIPRTTFDGLVASSTEFRRFVFGAFSRRVTDLCRVIDEVAFQRLDVRLAGRLLERAGDGDVVELTHQELAAELGTAREVVSRQVHELQRRGWLMASRGHIEIRNKAALAELAAS